LPKSGGQFQNANVAPDDKNGVVIGAVGGTHKRFDMVSIDSNLLSAFGKVFRPLLAQFCYRFAPQHLVSE